MANESAGTGRRKNAVIKSAPLTYALAVLLDRGGANPLASVHYHTLGSLVARGWIERRPHPEMGAGAVRYHLTDAGRAVAEASPAVREWLGGWRKCDRPPAQPPRAARPAGRRQSQ